MGARYWTVFSGDRNGCWWTGLIWLRIGSSDGLLWALYWACGFSKSWEFLARWGTLGFWQRILLYYYYYYYYYYYCYYNHHQHIIIIHTILSAAVRIRISGWFPYTWYLRSRSKGGAFPEELSSFLLVQKEQQF